MKTKRYMNALLILGLIFTMIPMAGCSKDDDEELGSNGGAVLTVNGKNGKQFLCLYLTKADSFSIALHPTEVDTPLFLTRILPMRILKKEMMSLLIL